MGDTYITNITHFEGLPPKLGKGPAGMEAARVAALRGHQVSLYEKGKEPSYT